ncbi:Tannase/feruloyl esterase [Truncatella angustata]|uniref:Carboxylic ester hydrolase n=1 Tax=Truncatella angustata TaxID=152316 RepID=A0A9P8UC21_9PEZI|nr:Tannase/feruloyl esterase [Truncatella angustata]KAH6646161.1 Tannase/feruloyl esterase [Truncatella angustata]KAH8203892.1 hypothetical protein TruAng_001956 [Truncatella angustata]
MNTSISISPLLCAASTFETPDVFGVKFLALEALRVDNFSRYVSDEEYFHNPEVFVENVTFCNITVTYTHPGQQDTVVVEAWLPLPWNGRLQAVGSGGWTAGRTQLSYSMMSGAVGAGYATVTTDAGLGTSQAPMNWALHSPGTVNLNALQNLASVSLNEQALIGKHLTKSLYGESPKFSYFNGCSQGGRQGIQLAQRYPDAYDGIAAATPAIYWPQFFQAMLWPQLVMNELGEYPRTCELDFLQSAVINKCDADDGIVDGIIMDPDSCEFDPLELVGTPFYCNETGGDHEISNAGARVAQAYQAGAHGPDGEFLWYGPHWGANLTQTIFGTPGLAATDCTDEKCTGKPFMFSLFWMKFFATKNPSWSLDGVTRKEYARIFRLAVQEFTSIYGTADPDLSLFQEAGGKMITYHGLSDDITPSKNTQHYYKEVLKIMPDAHGFFRYFEVPGLGHCYGGNGGQPTHAFEALRDWVENGKAPDNIAIDVPRHGQAQRRVICPFPQKVRVKAGGEEDDPDTFYCS